MENVYDKFGGQPDDPHRHDYYIVLIVKKAKGKHVVDFNEFELSNNQIYFVSPGQVHQLLEEEKSFGYVITFSRQFCSHNFIEESFINDLYLFQENGFSPPLNISDDQLQQASNFAEQMLKCREANSKWKYQALGAWLKLLLILAQESCDLFPEDHTQNIQAGKTLLKDFKKLLEQNYTSWHKVGDYATALNITSDHLNNSVSSLTGKNVKAHIQSRIILAAKRMLLFSGLSQKEIAFQLGFNEPAHFSQFFKKQTQFSPSAFKKLY